ncbi:unnamed protein product [Angiostrongylus costaricensis]|uniref:1-acyl-sn-glycerol-3-phosphate acyltransferase n=1 Tax=Angiostrongylus costaricensis TaxID=334426 RepID=A0A0R3PD01_ANGCS|nr:unnamed protein product [Angiostrongylus costaricensis]
MAALAVMTNRFTPPEIVLGVPSTTGLEFRTRISSHSRFLKDAEEFAEQEAPQLNELP